MEFGLSSPRVRKTLKATVRSSCQLDHYILGLRLLASGFRASTSNYMPLEPLTAADRLNRRQQDSVPEAERRKPEAERMNITEAIRIALQSLWVNKLRSVLTLLGVVIGVAAVIAVVTFVSGINDYVAQKIFNLGADVFIIFKVSPAVTNVDHYLEGEKRKDLTMEDYQAVADACRHCVRWSQPLRATKAAR